MLNLTVSEELCSGCGECSRDCIAGIMEQIDDKPPFIRLGNEPSCLGCQHCLAVCPTGALSIHNRNPAESQELCHDNLPPFEQMMLLVRGRRSVRQYKAENVSPGLIRELLAALANAPTAGNRRELTYTVIADREVMQRFQEKTTAALAAVVAKHAAANDWFLETAAPVYLEKGPQVIFHGAPHVLIVSAPTEVFSANVDVILAMAYFELLAQSAGLGTVWCGMLKALLETVPEIKELIGLPADCFYYTMLFGLPSVRYYRTVQRDDSAAIRTVAL